MSTYATSERTRAALVDAAGELFTRYGIDGVSTRAIAERAGENIGSIHYHFGGKRGLLEAALETFFEAWDDNPLGQIWEKHRDSLDTKEEKAVFLKELVGTYFDRVYFSGQPWWCSGLLHQLFTYENELSDLFLEKYVREQHDLLKQVAKRLNPDFTDEQAFAWGQTLVGAVVSLSLMRPMLQRIRGCQVEDPYPESLLLETRRQITESVVHLVRLSSEVCESATAVD